MEERDKIEAREICKYAEWFPSLDIFQCRALFSYYCEYREIFGMREYCKNPKFKELEERLRRDK